MLSRFIALLLATAGVALVASCDKAKPPSPTPLKEATNAAAPQSVETNVTAPPLPPTVSASPVTPAPDPTPPEATPAVQSDKRTLLKPKWPVGNRYVFRMEMDQRSTNEVPYATRPMVEQVDMGVTYALTVVKETAGGSRDLEVEFLAYDLAIRVGEKPIVSFDSSQSSTNEADNVMAAPFRKLVGSRLPLELESGGTVATVSGRERWLQEVTGGKQDAGELMLGQQFNEGFFQQLAEFGRGLPTEPVEAGGSWPYTIEVPAGAIGKIAAESTITLVRWDEHDNRKLAVLETKGTLRGIPGSKDSGSLSLEQGTLLGRLWFDPQMGGPVESVVEQGMRLKGDAPAEPELHRNAFTFTTEIGQKVTVKLVEVK